MKKGFTLVELMISIILLSLITSFLYQSLAQLQNSNQQLLTEAKKVDAREDILKLLYNDFINARSVTWLDKDGNKDSLMLHTANSFYDMSEPYVYYKVYKDNKKLKRVESPIEALDYEESLYRFDTLAEGVNAFKIYESRGHYLVYVKIEGMEDIYLDIIPPALVVQKDSSAQTDNNSSVDKVE